MYLEEILLTARLILTAIVGCFVIGLPAVILGTVFCKRRPNAEDIWFYAPLVGAAVIILICQNLIYVDVTVSRSAILIWGLAAAGWLWVLSSSKRSLLRPVPWPALVLGAVVYLVHASGLLWLGASNYYGYGWGDMFNYVSMAQFFADYSFHSNLSDQGFLVAAQYYKYDRIGQSVLHSFLMFSSGSDAQQSYGSTSFLSPFLMFFGFLTIARRFTLPSLMGYLAATAGALSPTVATIHLECFFSQSICMPFLLLWPAAVGYLVDRPGWRSVLLAGLLMSVISAIYTELFPIILAIGIVCCLVRDVLNLEFVCSRLPESLHAEDRSRRPFVTTFFWLPLAVIVSALVNMGYLRSGLGIFSRTTTGVVLQHLYPWAFKLDGVARLWLGNQVLLQDKWIVTVLVVMTVLMFISIVVSLISAAKHSFSIFFLGLVLLMFVPLGPLLAGNGVQYPYQFYKLLLTISSIHAFWFVAGLAILAGHSIVRQNIANAFAVVFVAVSGCLTLGMTGASAKVSTVATSHRGGANLLIEPDFRCLRNFLGETRDRDVFVLWYDNELYSGGYRSAWIDYFARYNRVRSLIKTTSFHVFSDDEASASIDARFSEQNIQQISSAIVVTWKPIDELKDRLLIGNRLLSVYQARSKEEIRRLIDAAQIMVFRKLRLDVTSDILATDWYPVWTAGPVGSATLLTIKFGEFNEFRYDQWGYPAIRLTPQGECRGKVMSLTVQLMLIDKRLRLTCNGSTQEAQLPLAYSSLPGSGPARFGENDGIALLEGKYPLAVNFPGSVVEIP
jgi:hypothetical protein